MPKLKWGLKGDPGEIEGRNVYDGPTPPKGVYICALIRLSVRENSSGDNMISGLLEIRDPRTGKSKFNGYSFWFNRNVTDQGAKFVKNFITQGLGVPMKGLQDLDKLIVTEDDTLPTPINSVGKVKIASEPKLVVVVRRRRNVEEPELETDDYAPAFPGIDPAKLAKDSEDDDVEDAEDELEDEDDEEDDPFEDSDDDEDEDDEDEEDDDEDEEEEEELTRDELKKMGVAELRELAVEQELTTEKKAKSLKKPALIDLLAPEDDEEPEDEDDEELEEDEEEPPPPPKKKTAKKTRK